MSVSRRRFLGGAAALAALQPVSRADAAVRHRPSAPFMLDDASQLNATPINRQAILTSTEAKLLHELRATLGEAASAGRPVAMGGARHSMGGQSLPRNGIAASFAASVVEPDTARKIYRVSAGARWRDVIRVLDPIGFSPAVTQSNHDSASAAP
jgi:FAD/FMN-containing dehydrogenase